MTPKCAIGRLQSTRQDVEQVKRNGWQQQQILVVAVSDDRLNWLEREFVRQIGEKLYGTANHSA